MTIGTMLAFVFTGVIVLVAIVGGIWLEARMPDPQERLGLPSQARQSRPATTFAGDHRADLPGPAWDEFLPRGRHRR